MNTSQRILANTVAQYVRIIAGAVLLLYSTRIVLQELGVSDFGLYSLLGSVLAFMSFLGTALARSTQRYLSYYTGVGKLESLRGVFLNSLLLHVVVGLALCGLVMACEPLMFSYIFDITPDRLSQAHILYAILVAGMFVTIFQAPYMAVFIAHENIIFISAVYVIAYVMRLAGAFALAWFATDMRVVIYGIIMVVIPAMETLAFMWVSYRKYDECRQFCRREFVSKSMLKELLGFSGWNIYGAVAILARQQGYAVALNHFTGLLYNAGYGIATQVSGQINNLVYSVMNAVSPVITKSEGSKDRQRMIYLSVESSKASFLSFTLIVMPFLFFMEPVLQAWLGEIPSGAWLFTLAIVLSSMADSIGAGFRTGIFAIGQIRDFSIQVYTVKMLSIVFSVLFFALGWGVAVSILPYFLSEVIGTAQTVAIFGRMTGNGAWSLMRRGFGGTVLPVAVSAAVCWALRAVTPQGWGLPMVLVAYIISTGFTSLIIYKTALDERERQLVLRMLAKFHIPVPAGKR